MFMHNLFVKLFTYNYHEMLKSQNVIPHEYASVMPTVLNRPSNMYLEGVSGKSIDEVNAYRATYEQLRHVFSDPNGSQWGDGGLLEWCCSAASPPLMGPAGEQGGKGADGAGGAGGADGQESAKGKEGQETEDSTTKDSTPTEENATTTTTTTTTTAAATDYNPIAAHIMMTVLLQSGHKMLTKALARMDRFGVMLYKMQRKYGRLACGVQMVEACHAFFNGNPHFFFCVIDGMIQRESLSINAFAAWVCGQTSEVLIHQYHLLEYLHTSAERCSSGQFTRQASTAANLPKSEVDEMDDLVTEEERKQNMYDMFVTFRNSIAEAESAVAAATGEAMTTVCQERLRVLREHGSALSSMVQDSVASTGSGGSGSKGNDGDEEAEAVAPWDLSKLSMID
jgi:hypothetical protein